MASLQWCAVPEPVQGQLGAWWVQPSAGRRLSSHELWFVAQLLQVVGATNSWLGATHRYGEDVVSLPC